MTIEIRQLIIRAEVLPGERPSPAPASGARGGGAGPWPQEALNPDLWRQEFRQEELVEACVRQVLRRLERHRDR
jgi:hypothetical protein